MARKMKSRSGPAAQKKLHRRAWTNDDHRELKRHSKAKTPVARISRVMKRSIGALRQQARKLGIGLGHRR
jgi:hypothetical protein